MSHTPPLLALTQGDPAGIGPEVIAKLVLGRKPASTWRPLLVVERSALEAVRPSLPTLDWDRLAFVEQGELPEVEPGTVPVIDPVGESREVILGESRAADAGAAVAALDLGARLAIDGVADGLVTAPVSKASIARHHLPDFRGHTDYLAAACGLERYGRDYLMAFLAGSLQVALVTVHEPLLDAVGGLTSEAILDAARASTGTPAGASPFRVSIRTPVKGVCWVARTLRSSPLRSRVLARRDRRHRPREPRLDLRARAGRCVRLGPGALPRPGPDRRQDGELRRLRQLDPRPPDRPHLGRSRHGVRHRRPGEGG